MSRITSRIHRTGGQFYYLYPAYVGPGLASWAASVVQYWYPVYGQGSTLTVDRLPGATEFHVGQVKSTWELPSRATGIPCRTIWLMQGSLIN